MISAGSVGCHTHDCKRPLVVVEVQAWVVVEVQAWVLPLVRDSLVAMIVHIACALARCVEQLVC